MKSYYISGEAKEGEYEEDFEKIVEAETEEEAIITLKKMLIDFHEIKIHELYETDGLACV